MRNLTLTILLLFAAFANAEEMIWDEADAFKTKLPDHESYSPFDMLDEQKRYEKTPKEGFNLSDEISDSEEVGGLIKPEIVKSKDYISPDNGSFFQYADMVLINKVTSKSNRITVAVGDTEYFGNIEIAAEKCWHNGDLYKPSHKMLLKIMQHKIDEDPKEIYHGWLISSNIPVCNMQSPTYEIIAMRCHDKAPKNR